MEVETSLQYARNEAGVHLTLAEQMSTFRRIRDDARSVLNALGRPNSYYDTASSQASTSFPTTSSQSTAPIPPFASGTL